jgi:hypothetical protein
MASQLDNASKAIIDALGHFMKAKTDLQDGSVNQRAVDDATAKLDAAIKSLASAIKSEVKSGN